LTLPHSSLPSAPVHFVCSRLCPLPSHVHSSRVEKLSAAVTAGAAAALANPLVAEAAITPSLKNTLLSVVAGAIVLAAIGVAVVGVSTFDKVNRK